MKTTFIILALLLSAAARRETNMSEYAYDHTGNKVFTGDYIQSTQSKGIAGLKRVVSIHSDTVYIDMDGETAAIAKDQFTESLWLLNNN